MSVVITNTPPPPEPREPKKPEPGTALEVKAKQLRDKALTIKGVANNDQYLAACEIFKGMSAAVKETQAFFDPIKKDAHRAWRNNCDRENAVLAPLQTGQKHISSLIKGYENEQERLRQEEEAKQRAVAAQKASDQVLEEAIALEEEGDIDSALAALEAGPGFVPAPSVPKTVPKVKGIVSRETFKARLQGSSRNEQVDPDVMTKDEQAQFLELIKAVAAGKVPLIALKVNWPFINAQARSMKKLLNYPGIEVYPDRSLSGRS